MPQEAERKNPGTNPERQPAQPENNFLSPVLKITAVAAIIIACKVIAAEILKGLREKITDRSLQEKKVEAKEKVLSIDFSSLERLGEIPISDIIITRYLPESETELIRKRTRISRRRAIRNFALVTTAVVVGTPGLIFGLRELAQIGNVEPLTEAQRIEAQKVLEQIRERRAKREQRKEQKQREKESTNQLLPTPYPEQGTGPLLGEGDLPEGLTLIPTATPPPAATPPPVETPPPQTKAPPESTPPPTPTLSPEPTPTPTPTPTGTPLPILQ